MQWVLLNLAGIAGRRRGLTGGPGTYRAPLYPLTHVVSLAGAAALAVLAWNDVASGRPGVIAVGTVIVVSLLYHALVLDRRPERWTVLGVAADTGRPAISGTRSAGSRTTPSSWAGRRSR